MRSRHGYRKRAGELEEGSPTAGDNSTDEHAKRNKINPEELWTEMISELCLTMADTRHADVITSVCEMLIYYASSTFKELQRIRISSMYEMERCGRAESVVVMMMS